jgi:DNA-binding NarL/FixJ family response regulator
MIKILVVDDHDLVRAGIRHLLSGETGFEVVGEAASGEEALQQTRALHPDVVLMDIHMPGMGGLEATRRLLASAPRTRVIAVTVADQEPFPSRLLKAGAVGYLTKGASAEEVMRAIRTVYNGQRYISGDIAQLLALSSYNGNPHALLDSLSEREMQVMLMVANCESVNDIAERLHLSPKTVNTYRYRIFEKLGISSDVEMTVLAIRHGMIDVVNDQTESSG